MLVVFNTEEKHENEILTRDPNLFVEESICGFRVANKVKKRQGAEEGNLSLVCFSLLAVAERQRKRQKHDLHHRTSKGNEDIVVA